MATTTKRNIETNSVIQKLYTDTADRAVTLYNMQNQAKNLEKIAGSLNRKPHRTPGYPSGEF